MNFLGQILSSEKARLRVESELVKSEEARKYAESELAKEKKSHLLTKIKLEKLIGSKVPVSGKKRKIFVVVDRLGKKRKIKKRLSNRPEFLQDLTIFNEHIIFLFSIIFANYKKQFPNEKEKNWTSLIRESEIDWRVENQLIRVLWSMNLTLQDVINFQSLRDKRNELCHPHKNLHFCSKLIEKNWADNISLQKMIKCLKKVSFSCDQVKNWRE